MYVSGEAETGLLVKFDKSGNLIWKRTGKYSDSGQGVSLALDSKGNIYVGGIFSHTLDLGEIVLRGVSQSKGFLIKYSADGEILWAKHLGNNSTNSRDRGGFVTVDQEDNVYFSCSFIYDIDFGNGIIVDDNQPSYSSDRQVYLIKINKDGNVEWGKSAGSYNEDYIVGLKTGPDNNLYLAIQSSAHEFTFEDQKYSIPRDASVLIRCTTDGRVEWLTHMRGRISSLDLDEKGNIYTVGQFYDEMDFDGTFPLKSTFSNFSDSKFLAKYRPNKAIEWAREIEAHGEWHITTSASNGQVYVSSSFHHEVKAGHLSLKGDVMDVFLLRYNEAGHAQWFKKIASDAADNVNSLAVSNDGRIAMVGRYAGTTMEIDGNLLFNNSGNENKDIFVAVTDDPVPNKCPENVPVLTADRHTICVQDMAILSVENHSSSHVQWYKNDQPLGTLSQGQLQVSEGGEYFFVLYDGSPCAISSNRISIRVVEAPDPSLAVSTLQSCDNKPIQLKAVENEAYSYQWFLMGVPLEGQNEFTLTATQTGNYHVVLKNEGTCTATSDLVSIEILSTESNFLPDTLYRCRNENLHLIPSNLQYQQWNLSWSTNETTSSIEIAEEGLYVLNLNKGDCSYTDQVWVQNFPELKVPNVITPNGDQWNERFFIENLEEPVYLQIYNRWGFLVYENRAYFNTWTADGLATDVYYYFILDKQGCREKNDLHGWVQVIR